MWLIVFLLQSSRYVRDRSVTFTLWLPPLSGIHEFKNSYSEEHVS